MKKNLPKSNKQVSFKISSVIDDLVGADARKISSNKLNTRKGRPPKSRDIEKLLESDTVTETTERDSN